MRSGSFYSLSPAHPRHYSHIIVCHAISGLSTYPSLSVGNEYHIYLLPQVVIVPHSRAVVVLYIAHVYRHTSVSVVGPVSSASQSSPFLSRPSWPAANFVWRARRKARPRQCNAKCSISVRLKFCQAPPVLRYACARCA